MHWFSSCVKRVGRYADGRPPSITSHKANDSQGHKPKTLHGTLPDIVCVHWFSSSESFIGVDWLARRPKSDDLPPTISGVRPSIERSQVFRQNTLNSVYQTIRMEHCVLQFGCTGSVVVVSALDDRPTISRQRSQDFELNTLNSKTNGFR